LRQKWSNALNEELAFIDKVRYFHSDPGAAEDIIFEAKEARRAATTSDRSDDSSDSSSSYE